MSVIGRIICFGLAVGLVGLTQWVLAHGPDDGPADGLMVTRHFTGIWDQTDHQSQGIALQVVEQLDDSRRAVAYWYTYGADRNTAWYIGIGDLVDNRIEMTLYESSDVGFLQTNLPGTDPVNSIGAMTITFESCERGDVTFETSHPDVGSGSFRIERLLEVMNTHCTGGISDDMHADAMFGEQRIELVATREGIMGGGHARYEDFPGRMEFEVEVEGLADGEYRLYVGGGDHGGVVVQQGHGELRFTSPGEDGHRLLNFDPRGMRIEIHDGQAAVLSSLDGMFEQDDHHRHGSGQGHYGDEEHNYDCGSGSGSGHGMGGGMGGMGDCVDEGDFLEIEVELHNTGVLPDARGEAEWEMNSHRVMFSVEIEGVPVGSYPLRVAGVELGIIQAVEMHNGEVYGHLGFRDPEVYGREHLDFEPREQRIEVMQNDAIILEVTFPAE